MRRHRFSNYWTSTETYDALKIYMDMDFGGLRADVVQMLSTTDRSLSSSEKKSPYTLRISAITVFSR